MRASAVRCHAHNDAKGLLPDVLTGGATRLLRSDACIARSQAAMSSGIIACVLVFYRKADELEDRGHNLRAADYYSRAAEAARALGPDNLVVLDMQRCQASMLRNYVATVHNTEAAVDPLAVAAHRADCVALFSAAVAALERRRAAGTLLEGKCTAAEEAWYAAQMRDKQMSAVGVAAWAPLIGYATCLLNSQSVLCLLDNAWLLKEECSASQFEAFAQHIVNAAELMQLPRSHGTLYMSAEVSFWDTFSSAMAYDLRARGLDASLVQLLTGARQRLQESGVHTLPLVYNVIDSDHVHDKEGDEGDSDGDEQEMKAGAAVGALACCACAAANDDHA